MLSRHSTNAAFTFIEMTITMLVMAILTAIVAPNYVSAISHYRVKLAAQRIVADLHYARSEAQRSSHTREVHFEVGLNRYKLIDVNDIDERIKAYNVSLVDSPFSAVLVSASFGGDERVTFDRFGRPDDAGTVELQSGGVTQTINLAADGTATRL